jgi:hypothetical protein
MAIGYIIGGGGGGVVSSDVTAKKENVLTGTSTITSDSDDAVVNGTMPNIGKVTQTLGVNGTYTIPKGYHNGTGTVSQSIATKGAATYYPSTSDQTIAANQYLTGAQTIKAISQQNLTAANIKKGVTVYVKNGNGNLYAVTGTWEGYVPTTNQPFNRGAWGSGWSIIGQAPRESNYGQQVTISYPGSSIHLIPANPSDQGQDGGAYIYLPRTTMNGKNTINIRFSGNIGEYSNSSLAQSSRKVVVLGIWSALPTTQFSEAEATVFTESAITLSPTREDTLSINVASITTDQYIAFGAWAMEKSSSYLDITQIWFT